MFEITKGYKQGKGVTLYDIEDKVGGTTLTKVPKVKVVEMIGNSDIVNAKVQWWQGKPIVRVQGVIELVKIDSDNNSEQRIEKRTVCNRGLGCTQHRATQQPTIQSTVMGKTPKKRSNETVYEGINKQEIDEHRKLSQTINYKSMETLEDLVDTMISDFKLSDAEKYKGILAKKIKLNQKITGMAQSNLIATQESIAVYLMNMANMETRNTYIKYMGI